MKYYIGIDAGTTNVKAVLFDEKGKEIKIESEDNHVYRDHVLSQQNMNELFGSVLNVLKKIFQYCKRENLKVKAMGVAGQGEGLWAIDKIGNPVFDAILWNDGRANRIVEEIKKVPNCYTEIKKVLGSYIRSGSTITLIKWFRENQPKEYEKVQFFFTCKDWIRYRLTGEVYWELSDASCSCIDLKTGSYAEQIFQLLEIKDAVYKLPELKKAIDYCGSLKEDIKKELDIDYDVPVSGGMIDIVSSAAGIGATGLNDVCIILGTTGMTFSVKGEYQEDSEINGWEYHINGKHLIKGMGTMAATPNLDWLLKTLNMERNFEKINENIKNFLPFESGILFHPHISNAGERAPFHNQYACADFLGIKEKCTKYDLIHAVLEGISFSIKDCLAGVPTLKAVYLTGGGSKNEVWAQILADILACEVQVSETKELGAKGAALSAFIMSEKLEIEEAFKAFIPYNKCFKNNKMNSEKYLEIYALYKETQKNMQLFWTERHKLIGG